MLLKEYKAFEFIKSHLFVSEGSSSSPINGMKIDVLEVFFKTKNYNIREY